MIFSKTYNKKLIGGKELFFDYKVISKKIFLEDFIFNINFNKLN